MLERVVSRGQTGGRPGRAVACPRVNRRARGRGPGPKSAKTYGKAPFGRQSGRVGSPRGPESVRTPRYIAQITAPDAQQRGPCSPTSRRISRNETGSDPGVDNGRPIPHRGAIGGGEGDGGRVEAGLTLDIAGTRYRKFSQTWGWDPLAAARAAFVRSEMRLASSQAFP